MKSEKINGIMSIVLIIAIILCTFKSAFVLVLVEAFLSINLGGEYIRINKLRNTINLVHNNCKKIWNEYQE